MTSTGDELKQKNSGESYVFKRENINFRKSRETEQKRKSLLLPNKRLFVYAAILLFVAAIFASVRNFAYLINPDNYKNKQKTEIRTGLGKYDWDPEMVQIVIVDDDDEAVENTNQE